MSNVTGESGRLAFYVQREDGRLLTDSLTWTINQAVAWKTYDRIEAGARARAHNAKALPVKERS